MVTIFWSLITHHSSFITHHSKIPCLFDTITHFPSLNIFHIICGPHTCHSMQFFFFFLFSVPKLTEPSEKKKKRKKKNRTANPREERKKKSQKVVKRCGRVLFVGSLCVFNYNIAIELWVIETENRQNVFSVSITHRSEEHTSELQSPC